MNENGAAKEKSDRGERERKRKRVEYVLLGGAVRLVHFISF